MQATRFALRRIVITVLLALGITAMAFADDRPSDGQIAFAKQVSDLLVNELVAALFTEFNETTPANVEHGKQAISIIFNNGNRDIRLIGTFRPLGGSNNLPSGRFERTALEKALDGEAHTAVENVDGRWFYRRSVALSNTFHANCVLCHTNFTSEFFERTNNPGQWTGALVLRVAIKTRNDD
jgi:hypothetical protein